MFKFVGVVIGTLLLVLIFLYFNIGVSDLTITEPLSTGQVSLDSSNANLVPSVELPLSGSAPETNTKHIIPIEEIKRGCFRQDCIPSVDSPQFSKASELHSVLSPDSIGIALSYKGVNRFYPFPMLETHELVNDTVAGDPILVSYCPLCGTGIVFEREVGGQAVEFGVSGMLWQSNLLMYNRAAKLEDRNLWSQVLGTAVVGNRAGEKLTIVPSDIMKFSTWATTYPDGEVLNTGLPQDPYGGEYYRVAAHFEPNFDESAALIPPDSYVYGIVVDSQPVAVTLSSTESGTKEFLVNDQPVIVTISDNGVVSFTGPAGNTIPDVEGFWFSWQAAHPDTIVVNI